MKRSTMVIVGTAAVLTFAWSSAPAQAQTTPPVPSPTALTSECQRAIDGMNAALASLNVAVAADAAADATDVEALSLAAGLTISTDFSVASVTAASVAAASTDGATITTAEQLAINAAVADAAAAETDAVALRNSLDAAIGEAQATCANQSRGVQIIQKVKVIVNANTAPSTVINTVPAPIAPLAPVAPLAPRGKLTDSGKFPVGGIETGFGGTS